MRGHRVSIRLTAFGLLMLSVLLVGGFFSPVVADPQVTGVAWTALATIFVVGLVWPVAALIVVQVRVKSSPSDATVGRAYDVAGPEPLSLRQIVETTGRAVDRRPRLVPLPLGPAVAAVRAYEWLSARPRLKVEQVLRLDEDKAFDIGDAKSLGYAPRSFAEGIAAEAALLG